ncbi:hypothetical protein QBC40DRAFT_188065, partial [Triangularia verruculosa]
TTPLLFGLITCNWRERQSPRRARCKFVRAVKLWLEDLVVSGTDLVSYGSYEITSHRGAEWLREWRWGYLNSGRAVFDSTGPKLESFSFGQRPEDCVFAWDLGVEEFAGDFWQMTDDSPPNIPGAWVDEEA